MTSWNKCNVFVFKRKEIYKSRWGSWKKSKVTNIWVTFWLIHTMSNFFLLSKVSGSKYPTCEKCGFSQRKTKIYIFLKSKITNRNKTCKATYVLHMRGISKTFLHNSFLQRNAEILAVIIQYLVTCNDFQNHSECMLLLFIAHWKVVKRHRGYNYNEKQLIFVVEAKLSPTTSNSWTD